MERLRHFTVVERNELLSATGSGLVTLVVTAYTPPSATRLDTDSSRSSATRHRSFPPKLLVH
ncbi:hypothetical protein [Haladaptatus halobius]|uniref:hypothetical protein n=1 Tax=Haladaptatus halobius TaxID=2884875 RepID=UPI001D0A011B|nr:hypothetical protein [Haladaptatus halobius]